MLLRSSLTCADHPLWTRDDSYSPVVAASLRQAYAFLASSEGSTSGYLRSAQQLIPFWNGRMSDRQRIRVFFIIGSAHTIMGEYDHALKWYDRALEITAPLREYRDMCELLLLRGSVNRAELRFMDACDDLQACQSLLSIHSSLSGPENAGFRLQVLAQLAGYEFFSGHLVVAAQVIDAARNLLPFVPQAHLDAAALLWAEAHLCRAEGNAEQALSLSLRACMAYEAEANLISQGRLHGFVADVALDLVEQLPSASHIAKRRKLLMEAHSHVTRAMDLAHSVNDSAGRGLASLARARYSRLMHRNEDRISAIESVIRLGHQLDDEALLGEGFTALGDEFTLREPTSARNCYAQALGIMDGTQMPTVGIRARRALSQDKGVFGNST
jgi:tetratricopeptide (TPR) repeat protein